MPADATRFKQLRSGYNRNVYNNGGMDAEDARQQERQKSRESLDAELERQRNEQRERARRERQGI